MNSLQDFQTSNKLDHELTLSSLPPTPSKSTAFTIEFDDLNNNSQSKEKKKFEKNSLRESLRKYAPDKLDKLTKLKKDKNNSIKNDDTNSLNYNLESSDKNLSDGATFLIEKMFSASNSNSSKKSASSSKIINQSKINATKLTNKTNSKEFYSDGTSRTSRSCKSSPLKLHNFNSSANFNSTNTDSGVQMCADEENQSLDYLKSTEDDNHSESGTYTVELDNQDPIAEEARKRIDEIFGCKGTNYKYSDTNSSNSSIKASSKQSFKISSLKKSYQDLNHSSQRSRHNSGKSQTNNLQIKQKQNEKIEMQRKNSISSSERLSFRDRKSSLQNPTLKRQDSFSKSSVSKLSVSSQKAMNKSSVKRSQLNQNNINLINQRNTFVFNCNSGSSSLIDRARANSITRKLNKGVLNKNEDKNSIKSDEQSTNGSGTDLSSINSDKYKSDAGQTSSSLRLNRAFALRRARLGIDTPPTSSTSRLNKIKSTNDKQHSNKPNSKISHTSDIPITNFLTNQSRSSSQCSTAKNEQQYHAFDRSDGGRFSLRENSKSRSSSSKPPINQSSKLVNGNKSIKQESSLIKAISMTKDNVLKKMIRNNQLSQESSSNHVRANSFSDNHTFSNLNGDQNETIVLNSKNLNKLRASRLSSTASTSSNNTLSNASTSEDLSNISDQMNVKQLQNLSSFQLGRRIYSTKPHYIQQTNSFRIKLEENASVCPSSNGGFNDSSNQIDSLNQFNELPSSLKTETKKKFGQLSIDSNISNGLNNNQTNLNINSSSNGNKSLSALDYLVLSAVHQLSFKGKLIKI